MLHVAVGDPPWNTGMAWADAVHAFPDRPEEEVDDIVSGALLALLDEGYIWFFRATGFDDEFRPRSEDEALGREEVAAVLAGGRRSDRDATSTTSAVSLSSDGHPREGTARGSASVGLGDLLSFCATERGEQRHARLSADEYRIFRRTD